MRPSKSIANRAIVLGLLCLLFIPRCPQGSDVDDVVQLTVEVGSSVVRLPATGCRFRPVTREAKRILAILEYSVPSIARVPPGYTIYLRRHGGAITSFAIAGDYLKTDEGTFRAPVDLGDILEEMTQRYCIHD